MTFAYRSTVPLIYSMYTAKNTYGREKRSYTYICGISLASDNIQGTVNNGVLVSLRDRHICKKTGKKLIFLHTCNLIFLVFTMYECDPRPMGLHSPAMCHA